MGRGLARGGDGHRPHRPGAGQEDFELGLRHGLPVLSPVDEAGRFYDAYGWLHGLSTTEAADQIVGRLAETGFLLEAGTYEHRYPHCWRCDTPLIWRVTDDWLIAVDELRQQLLDANATVEWTPAYMGKRMDDWLRNMGDWNISRRRYYGLPLPFYPCSCGHLNVIGSKAELFERATAPVEDLEELRRPWIDEIRDPLRGVRRRGRADRRGRRRLARRRDRPVLDARLAERPIRRRGLRDRCGEGAHDRRPARPRVLGDVVPRGLGVRDARADPALVLLAALHVGRADRPGAVPARPRLREDARREGPRDARLVGEHDRRPRRVRAHGRGRHALAVLLAAAEPEPPLRLRAGARDPAEAAHALELVQVPRRLREHRRLGARRGRISRTARRRARAARPLARRADARARRRGDGRVRELAHGRRRPRVRGVHRRRLQLVHPPLAQALLGRRPRRAAHALVRARPGTARRRAAHAVPHRPPLARADRRRARTRRTPSISRAGPRPPSPTPRSSPRSASSAAWSSSVARRGRPRA